MNKIEKKGNQGNKVDKNETDEDPLGDPDQVVHGASLKCQLQGKVILLSLLRRSWGGSPWKYTEIACPGSLHDWSLLSSSVSSAIIMAADGVVAAVNYHAAD